MTMLAPLELETLALKARSIHRIASARGHKVTCVKGTTWITQERDNRDIILGAGQSVVLERPGLAVVYAFKDALITVGTDHGLPAPAKIAARARAWADRAWA
jgi:hypothetical protein